ncbi:hypothetical protein EDB19DRAFT_1691047 [Suillus lakei]|nr:hypothetical protein EDB19DRAFT_1691047 [Suillus lakei]
MPLKDHTLESSSRRCEETFKCSPELIASIDSTNHPSKTIILIVPPSINAFDHLFSARPMTDNSSFSRPITKWTRSRPTPDSHQSKYHNYPQPRLSFSINPRRTSQSKPLFEGGLRDSVAAVRVSVISLARRKRGVTDFSTIWPDDLPPSDGYDGSSVSWDAWDEPLNPVVYVSFLLRVVVPY